jgi:hypothetical protein
VERDGGGVLHAIDGHHQSTATNPLRFHGDQERDDRMSISSESRGMGGEVSKQDYDHPTNDPETVPIPGKRSGVVFQGFDVNASLTAVTAYAVEEAAALDPDYDYTGDWKLVAFATCASESYFGGLERRSLRVTGGDIYDPELTVNISCSPGKKLMAIGDRVADYDIGEWFIHRAFRLNPFQQTAVGKAYLNPGGDIRATETTSILCVDK